MNRSFTQRSESALRLAGACFKRSGLSDAPVILMYHRVVRRDAMPYPPEPGVWVDIATFDKQLSFLAQTRQIVPFALIATAVRSGADLPPRACAITFDDGWLDNYTNAFPLLLRHNIPATIFLASGFIGTEMSFWTADLWDSLHALRPDLSPPSLLMPDLADMIQALARSRNYHLINRAMSHIKSLSATLRMRTVDYLIEAAGRSPGGRQMMNWDEVRAMHSAGVEFGVHTRTHPMLSELTRDEIDREIIDSKMEVESVLGERITALAYPYGDCDQRARLAAVEAGIEFACTTSPGNCAAARDAYMLPRIGVHEGMSEGFATFSSMAFAARLSV